MPFRTTSVQGDRTWRTTQFKADRRWTARELAAEVGVCHRTVLPILGYRKLSARWYLMKFPRCNNGIAMQSQRSHWTGTKREEDDFLGRIIAMDEIWTRSYEPNFKRQSNEWNHPGSPLPKKVHPPQCAMKAMFIVAYHIDGVSSAPRCTSGQTVNAAYYCMYLQNHLHTTLRKNDGTWWYRTPSFFMTMQGVTRCCCHGSLVLLAVDDSGKK